MALVQRQNLTQRLQQRADPQLLLTNRLLQMSSLELKQYLVDEIAENPALESPEELCADCHRRGKDCPECPLGPLRQVEVRQNGWDEERGWERVLWMDAAEAPDPFDVLRAQETLTDYLHTQLAAAAPDTDQAIGRYLIDSIDAGGYVQCTPEEAARVLNTDAERIERVLRTIQTFDPTGVGARTLQECLLLQANARRMEAAVPPHLVAMISQYWKELAAGKWPVIARGLRTSVAEVERTVTWLRRNLSPYPGLQFRPAWEKSGATDVAQARPDLLFTLDDAGTLSAQIVSEEAPTLHLNPEYARLLNAIREQPAQFSTTEQRHVQEFVTRAQMFLKSLGDRTAILRRVAECVLEEQEMFLRSEREEDMRPLTQAQLAAFLRVHESTISRAVAEKFVQLPSGRVVSMSYFFDRAVSYRRLVANVVASENPASPYSDQEISDLLRKSGVIIARRTVMKYREELNILSSRQRARSRPAEG